MNINELADQAFKKWEKTETFTVGIVEQHGFVNGFKCAYLQQQSEIESLQTECNRLYRIIELNEASK